MQDKIDILFVCTGNTCRSPMAAACAADTARRLGKALTVSSAGLSAFTDDVISENARLALGEIGLAPLSDKPAQFTAGLGQSAGQIYVMTEQHLDFIRGRFPDLADRSALLGEGISDPFGKDLPAYRRCLEQIRAAVTEVLRA